MVILFWFALTWLEFDFRAVWYKSGFVGAIAFRVCSTRRYFQPLNGNSLACFENCRYTLL